MSAASIARGVRRGVSRWLVAAVRDSTALALVALSLAVYTPMIWWGLPVATSEEKIHGWDVDAISGIAPLAEFNNLLIKSSPNWFVAYPLFHYFLLGASYAPYLGWLWLTGGLESAKGGYPFGFADPVAAIATLALIGRVLSLIMAIGIVLTAYAAASMVWNRRTGVAAALLAMLNLPMVYASRTGNLDVPVLFWTAMGVLMLAAISVRGLSVGRAVWLGIFAALATATKDQAYGGWVATTLAVIALHWLGKLDVPGSASPRWKAPAALIVSGLAAYLVAGGIVLHPQRFMAHMQFILTYEEARFAFAETALKRGRDLIGLSLLARDIGWTTVRAMGIPAAAMALAGCWAARRNRFVWLLAAMAAGYLVLVITPIAHMQQRYALLPAYMLSFPGAYWLCSTWNGSQLWRRVSRAGAVLAVVWMLGRDVDLTYQMAVDARYPAARWLSAHLAPGDRVGFFGSNGQLPAIPKGVIVERFEGRDSAVSALESASADVVLVIPDYTTPPGWERSLFLPEQVYDALRNGRLPYGLAATFDASPLFNERYPFVNPPVRIFTRNGPKRAE